MYTINSIIVFLFTIAKPLNWSQKPYFNQGLPQGIAIYSTQTTQSPFETKLTADFIQFNTNKFEIVTGISQVNLKTPMQFAKQYDKTWAVINGGFFNMITNYSVNFAATNNRIIQTNKINEDDKHHPTIGTFGRTKNGYEFKWIYSFDNKQTYWYNQPNLIPGPPPTKQYGVKWEPIQALGAGPLLIKSGIIQDFSKQNFNHDIIASRHPVAFNYQRSAICSTNGNDFIMFVADGRSDKSDGLSLPQLASLLQELGCIDALNLDGGGSTLLFANNKIINTPSDPSPRPVATALILKQIQALH